MVKTKVVTVKMIGNVEKKHSKRHNECCNARGVKGNCKDVTK